MLNVEYYLDEIDLNHSERSRELNELKFHFANPKNTFPYETNSKAVIVLSYSQWEGFYNDCVQIYINFLKHTQYKVKNVSSRLLLGVINNNIESLKDKNHSKKAKCEFIDHIFYSFDQDFTNFDENIVSAHSNLDFETLRRNFYLLNCDINIFEPYRLRIDQHLVKRRHQIAHGNYPQLSGHDLNEHVDFTQIMLQKLYQCFYDAIQKFI